MREQNFDIVSIFPIVRAVNLIDLINIEIKRALIKVFNHHIIFIFHFPEILDAYFVLFALQNNFVSNAIFVCSEIETGTFNEMDVPIT
jgi:hypothetical protein